MAVRPRHRASACIGALALASLVPLEACIGNDTPREANTETPAEAAAVGTETAESSGLIFINLLPWGEVDFTRGEFPSLGDCNAVVRALPTYSFHTTSERCEPIDDPVYCTVWRDGNDDRDSIACHKGPGGCEIELRRHDLLAETGTRTVSARCEPFPLDDAWERYHASQTASGEVDPQ